MPNPYGQALATSFTGGGGGVVTDGPFWETPPGVPLLACWKEEKTEFWLFLSGGASGEKPLEVVGCSRGGRRTLGRMMTPRRRATPR